LFERVNLLYAMYAGIMLMFVCTCFDKACT